MFDFGLTSLHPALEHDWRDCLGNDLSLVFMNFGLSGPRETPQQCQFSIMPWNGKTAPNKPGTWLAS
jgi:hypothetical protein